MAEVKLVAVSQRPIDLGRLEKILRGEADDQELASAQKELVFAQRSTPTNIMLGAAKTCYQQNSVTPSKAGRAEDKGRKRLAKSTLKAGHHTVAQHTHLTYLINGASRHVIWSFLHGHPHYNTEQQSQRYVEMLPESFVVPQLEGQERALFEETVMQQMQAYQQIAQGLTDPLKAAYHRRWSGRNSEGQEDAVLASVKKLAMENARYVLPLATKANMFYTINPSTLMRLRRMQEHHDVPGEQRELVEKMLEAAVAWDPEMAWYATQPIDISDMVEHHMSEGLTEDHIGAFREEFDQSLGSFRSKLIGYDPNAQEELAQAVREVIGIPQSVMSDEAIWASVINPEVNKYFSDVWNPHLVSKVGHALDQTTYKFKKRISHTADSQSQRHRSIQGARPVLDRQLSRDPDFFVPRPIADASDEVRAVYEGIMRISWDTFGKLLDAGVPKGVAAYVLPNALQLRYRETANLLGLIHRQGKRECWLAQHEISGLTNQENGQVLAQHPHIGSLLLAPCDARYQSRTKPYCPEGERFCGEKVWDIPLDERLSRREY